MRVTREIGFFSLLVLAALFVQNASATLPPMLPTSSYADGAWQGFRLYDESLGGGDFLRGRIDFAVYDTLGGNEFIEAGFEAQGEGQYIYAYQIFNDYEPASDEAVWSFAVFGIDEDGEPSGVPLVVDEMSIGSQEDPESGVEPTDAYFGSSNSRGVWEFGGGALFAGEHSWFLVFNSNSGPVPGSYEVKAPEEGKFPVSTPEPGTLMLLGIGGALIFTRRRKSAQ
jgi:hypothetical protein